VTAIEGRPSALAWLGSFKGHRIDALGVGHAILKISRRA
jgi:hypothetical protein